MNNGPPRPPMPPRGYGPAYGAPHETYVFQGVEARESSITRLTVPVLLVCSLAVFLVIATYLATSQFADIKHAIDKLSSKVETLTGELAARITRVEQDQADIKRETWTRRDQEVWCAKIERANQAMGWTCSEEGGVTARYVQPQVNGWSARVKQ